MITEDKRAYEAVKAEWDKQHNAFKEASDVLSGLANGS